MTGLKIAVVGAGVVGLTTALEFQREFSDVRLDVIADAFNEDTTSDGAAGLFFPSSNFTGPNLTVTRNWMRDSYDYYENLMNKGECNVSPITGFAMSNYSQEACENHFMKPLCSDYRKMSVEELHKFKGRVKFGVRLSTMVIPCRKLLPWSLSKIQRNGGLVVAEKIRNFSELDEYDVIVNCAGLGARELCEDMQIVPIRGQIIQARASWIENFHLLDSDTYVIPYSYGDIVTLGGTQDYGSYSKIVDSHQRNSIMERCSRLVPTTRVAAVLREWVGLRPYRPVVRVEIQSRNDNIIVHNYGHGGYGVTTAPGSAKYALELFRDYHKRDGGSKWNSKL